MTYIQNNDEEKIQFVEQSDTINKTNKTIDSKSIFNHQQHHNQIQKWETI